MKKQFLEAGKIVGTHGIHGELRVQSWCDAPEVLCALESLYNKDGTLTYKVLTARVHKNLVLMTLEGVDTVEQADTMRERVLYLRRDDVQLAEETYFIQDLIGLDVVDADSGRRYGKLTDVLETGANDVYEITDDAGVKTLIPSIPAVIVATDVESGIMRIRPLEGLFEHEN